jgi:hypothetical protein
MRHPNLGLSKCLPYPIQATPSDTKRRGEIARAWVGILRVIHIEWLWKPLSRILTTRNHGRGNVASPSHVAGVIYRGQCPLTCELPLKLPGHARQRLRSAMRQNNPSGQQRSYSRIRSMPEASHLESGERTRTCTKTRKSISRSGMRKGIVPSVDRQILSGGFDHRTRNPLRDAGMTVVLARITLHTLPTDSRVVLCTNMLYSVAARPKMGTYTEARVPLPNVDISRDMVAHNYNSHRP